MFDVSLCGPSKGTLRCYTSICDGIIGKKILVNVQKILKGGSDKADFLYGEKIDHAEKKTSK